MYALTKRIEEAKRGNWKTLSLEDFNIKVIPDSICELNNLEVLIISRLAGDFEAGFRNFSGIHFIPQEISNLTSLKELYIGGNFLKNLYPISKLKNLEILDLSYSEVHNISFLKELRQLKHLYLNSTSINDISSLRFLEKLETLNISNTDIYDISPIKNITSLKNIDLYGTHIQDISSLANLSSLENIQLSNTIIDDLRSLENLENIKEINLSETKISSLRGIEKNKELISLSVNNNNLFDLSIIQNFPNLQTLKLRKTSINKLPDFSGLDSLEYLDVSITSVKDLTPIEDSLNLKYLNISYTEVNDLSPLRNLEKLEFLDLQYSEVADLRPVLHLIEKNIPLTVKNATSPEKRILINGTPLILPPLEVALSGNMAIKEYFEELELQGIDYLYEAKMLIIGEARVGKTTLKRKLLDPNSPLPNEEESTKGIDIDLYKFNIAEDNPFIIHIWDFGGQEIYRATHQFFLTKRSLYILVDDSDRDDTQLDRWLRRVELLADKSPVLIIQNQKNRPKENDLKGLRKSFTHLLSPILSFNFALKVQEDEMHLKSLLRIIKNRIQELELVGIALPRGWVKIREALSEISLTTPFITLYRYLSICKAFGVSSKAKALELSRHLHDLGIFLHFQNDFILDNIIILRNEWATNAVYKLLDSPSISAAYGRFSFSDAQREWKDKQYDGQYPALLKLMTKFEICYQLQDVEPPTYIAPQLLSFSEPNYDWPETGTTKIYFIYQAIMPAGLISRFIVRMHYYSEDPKYAWRRGVYLKYKDAFAKIAEDYGKNQITIEAHGVRNQFLISLIISEFDKLHQSFGDELQKTIKKYIPCICSECKSIENESYLFDLDRLIYRLEKGKRKVECPVSFEDIDVRTLLGSIYLNVENRLKNKSASPPAELLESKIRRAISSANPDLALEIMRTIIEDKKEFQYSLTMIESTHSKFKKDCRERVLSNDEMDRKSNEINSRILDLMEFIIQESNDGD